MERTLSLETERPILSVEAGVVDVRLSSMPLVVVDDEYGANWKAFDELRLRVGCVVKFCLHPFTSSLKF